MTGRYFSCARKATTALNFFGGRFLNDGIGAVGLTSVRAIPCRGRRAPTFVHFGPGPAFPFSPILWQAKQPDWATTFLPASYSARILPPCAVTDGGVFISIAVGEPALA